MDGFISRKIKGLPKERCLIEIVVKEIGKDIRLFCEWNPYNPEDYFIQPAEGFLGTAKVVQGKFKGIGYHAWDQNESEFIYYKITKT